ncbi:hypothetical protein ACOMHN_011036 [Nucella lapillus]
MESYIGIVIGVVVFKIILISIYCCVRHNRMDRTVILVDGSTMARRQRSDGVAIITQAQPMGTSHPPYPPANRPHRPPPYNQAV